MVEAANGKFVKWTGDGFLAWLETPLHRELGARVNKIFMAAWQLSFLINVTQLGLDPARKFQIRHGITYEQDASVTTITHPGGYQSFDLVGRAVVLAFRLSGIQSDFPSIITQRELVQTSRVEGSIPIAFKKWLPGGEEKLRYFKGESWGLNSIYRSGSVRKKATSLSATIKKTKKTILKAESYRPEDENATGIVAHFIAQMETGPDWCKEVVNDLLRFIREDLLGTLKETISMIKEYDDHKT